MAIREFTELEDDIIRRYASGELIIQVRQLERLMKRMWSTIQARAHELNINLDKKKRSSNVHQVGITDSRTEKINFMPYTCTVGEDELLTRLRLLHPDRAARYG